MISLIRSKIDVGTNRIKKRSLLSWPKLALVLSVVICGALLCETALAQNHKNKTPEGDKQASSKKLNPSQPVSIDFNNVDINVLIKFISEMTGKNFVVDQRVKGKVTIISPSKISVAEAYRVFESVLEVHGYTTVKSGKIIKIVPARMRAPKTSKPD